MKKSWKTHLLRDSWLEEVFIREIRSFIDFLLEKTTNNRKKTLKKANSSHFAKKNQEKKRNNSVFLKKNHDFSSPRQRSHTFLDKSFEKSLKIDNFIRESANLSSEIANTSEKALNKDFLNENSANIEKSNEKAFIYEKSYDKEANIIEKSSENNEKSYQKALINETSQEDSSEKPVFIAEKPKNSEISLENSDIQRYIHEQEAYLAQLEADRLKLQRKLDNPSNKQEKNIRKYEEITAFIQELHEKENSFIENEYSQQKADNLLEKFLGNPEKIGKTPEKTRKIKENSVDFNLSYSISQEPVIKYLKKREIIRFFLFRVLRKV